MATKKAVILKFSRENSEKRDEVKKILKKQATKLPAKPRVKAINSEDDLKWNWKLEKEFMSAWLCKMEEETYRRFEREIPGKPSNFYAANSAVVDVDDDKYVWVSIGNRIRYVVVKKTCLIYEVSNNEGKNINNKRCYGPVRYWDQWSWDSYYPVKKSWYGWQHDDVREAVPGETGLGLDTSKGSRPPQGDHQDNPQLGT